MRYVYINFLFLLLLLVNKGNTASAQSSTINTTIGSTGYNGTNWDGTSSFITFVVENNSGIDVTLTDVGRWSDPAYNNTTNTLWYTTTSLSGAVTLATPVWTQVASQVPTTITGPLQVNPVITGISFNIPNGAIYRFGLYTTATNYYSGTGVGTCTPNTFTTAGVTVRTGDYQIAGGYVGYGGANNPRFFTGFITFKPAAVPCNGIPSNALVLGPNQVCPKANFNLSIGLSNNLAITGLSYQWETSANGTSWSAFTGTVNPVTGAMTDAITTPTYYRCKVTCIASGQSFTTPAKLVGIAPFYYCYCSTTATAAAGIDIGNVLVTTLPLNDILINNGTITTVENNASATKGYTDFRYTVPAAPMYHDSSYKIVVSQINSAAFVAGMAAVYIDYNRNGAFDDSESILLQSTANILPNPGVTSSTFKLPASADYGLTGMRVIMKGGSTPPDTCGNYANGETEDYLIDLRFVPCNGKPDIGHIEGDTSMCPGYNYVLRDTSYEKHRHGIEHYWQVSADGVYWVDISNSKDKDTLTRYFTGQPLFYRAMGVCTHSNDTSYSPTHKVNLKPAYKCYCHSQSMGTYLDTSDIGGFTIANFSVTDGGTHLLNPRAFNQRQDYTDLEPIKLDVDSTYKFTVFHTMPFENHADGKVTVFVDFNNNKKYDIPEERIFTGFTSIGYHVLINNLIIPNTVIVDVPTGLRVIVNNDVSPGIPSDEGCGEYISGETEDYIVMFKRSFAEGINETGYLQQLSLSPNPTNGRFEVQFKGGAVADGVTVRILNMTGQLVKQEVYPHNGGIFRQQVDLGNEAKGIYMVEVTANGQKMIQKLTVQ